LDLAGCLFSRAFGFDLRVAGNFASGFLDGALYLMRRTLNTDPYPFSYSLPSE
jgi:hypothetical protein